jgi:ankyrin repeat protein
MEPRPELVQLVVTVDSEGIEAARGHVTTDDAAALSEWYWQLDGWPRKLALVELIQDQYHPAMDRVLLDALRAPGDGEDWVDIPKMIAVGVLDEDLDNFALYLNDRRSLSEAVDRLLARHGLEREVVVLPPAVPKPWETAPLHPNSPNARVGGDPVLIRAIMDGRSSDALYLIDAGADPNCRRRTADQPALWWAAGQGMTDVVEALLSHGADVDACDQWGSTPLINAATGGRTDAVRILLAAGADPRARIYDDRTVLNLAIRGGKPEILELLLEAGANLQSPQPNFTPLALACFEGTTAMVELLVARGADVNRRITYGGYRNATPLMYAANAGKIKMVQVLLDGGADARSLDDDGQAAADYARGKRADRIREMLGR